MENPGSFRIFCLETATAVLLASVFSFALFNGVPQVPTLTPGAADARYFKSFDTFYPFYLQEHTHDTSRLLHFGGTACCLLVCLLNQPHKAVGVFSFGGLMGLVASRLCTGMPEAPAYEAFAALGGLLVACQMFYFPMRALVLCLVCGYGAAWAGHFYFEKNQPATFTYPVWSFAGDVHLFFDMVSEYSTRGLAK
ncbi:hypothetical protein DIPPA_32563 [Diplonema papillatum]|nr:hypothetical protein DIPPA_32563 [Diplonema papillatum]